MKTLHLTLKKKWFEMIASGEKTEEYREPKDYWMRRLQKNSSLGMITKTFDLVTFKNGYSKNASRMTFKCNHICTGEGRPEWGAEPGVKYFVIKLGERIK
jgi:hypothetical protein